MARHLGGVEGSPMTPLQVYALVLAERRKCNPPDTADARALRRWIKMHSRTAREREMAGYLIAASDGRLGRRGGGGSLKHVLWWLRDYAGPLYLPAAKGVLRYLLDHPGVSLAGVAEHLQFVPTAAHFADLIRQGANGAALAEAHLEVCRVGRWLVAVNRTTLNLTSVAMRHTPADLYVAASERGMVIKVRREVSFPLGTVVKRLRDGWVLPYPDLAVGRRAAKEGDLEQILEAIRAVER